MTAVIAIGCSAGDGSVGGVSYAELCAGTPPVNADGTATMASCPWVQQASNITKYGVTQQRALYDGTGARVATVASTCDKWTLATGDDGITVIVAQDTGRVISHGSVHPGQPISTLPTTLALPLEVR
ncbi:MAG TPA: hypothetical protein VGH28_20070 [Polyangiaceae bacterium]|jgi:hypothetical protein